MIKESIYSKDEISITDTSKTEIIRWKRFITDHRISKDVGPNTVDLFNLDSFEVEPKYFITKTYEHGTSFKNYLHAIMNNGDEITMRSFGIRPSLERDQFQEYKIGSEIVINGEEFKNDKYHYFEYACDLYFRWIETRPENFKIFEVTF
jgi:hypothetical protein